jgi:phosphoglycolate phosphatase
MIRLAVFDLDGTLVDSRRDLATAANALVRELGGTPLNEEAVGDMVGEGAGVLVRRALAAAGLAADAPGALDRFLSLYDAHLLDTTAPYEGIDELLHGLAGRVAIAVLTNKPQHASERMLDGLGLLAHFAAVIGGDTRHGRKPDPAGLRHLAAHFDVAAGETLLVGDSPIDLETARRAGTQICLVSYGFGFRPVDLREGERVVASPRDVANLF